MKKLSVLIMLLFAGSGLLAQSPGGPGKVGSANMEYILPRLPEVQDINAGLKETQAEMGKQIDSLSAAFRKKYEAFAAGSDAMSDTVRARVQKELEDEYAGLEKLQQDAQEGLQNRQRLYMAPVYLNVNRAIREVAQENGYYLILNQQVSGYRLLLFRQEPADISDLVLKKLGVTDKPAVSGEGAKK